MSDEINSTLWNTAFQGLAALGTIAVAILAIWGDWVRARLVPPKLALKPHNIRGTVTKFTSPHPDLNDKRVIFYHLKVVNLRPWAPARNCRVLLRAMFKRASNQEFVRLPMAVPAQFVWAPAELTPPSIPLSREQILDFGILLEGSDHFVPKLYSYANDFQGRVHKDEVIRYSLEITADGYSTPQYQEFEVAWDGIWSDNLDKMERSLIIREVTEDVKGPTTT